MSKKFGIAVAALTVAIVPLAASAAEYEVKMLNKGADGQMMVFEPAFLQIAPGDVVNFVPTQPSHNAESILTMLPEGAQAFRGGMNQTVSVTFTKEGVYGVKCLPHYGLGMVALIRVGSGVALNAEPAASMKHPPMAQKRMQLLLQRIQ
jgi:pseudoazurin